MGLKLIVATGLLLDGASASGNWSDWMMKCCISPPDTPTHDPMEHGVVGVLQRGRPKEQQARHHLSDLLEHCQAAPALDHATDALPPPVTGITNADTSKATESEQDDEAHQVSCCGRTKAVLSGRACGKSPAECCEVCALATCTTCVVCGTVGIVA